MNDNYKSLIVTTIAHCHVNAGTQGEGYDEDRPDITT